MYPTVHAVCMYMYTCVYLMYACRVCVCVCVCVCVHAIMLSCQCQLDTKRSALLGHFSGFCLVINGAKTVVGIFVASVCVTVATESLLCSSVSVWLVLCGCKCTSDTWKNYCIYVTFVHMYVQHS